MDRSKRKKNEPTNESPKEIKEGRSLRTSISPSELRRTLQKSGEEEEDTFQPSKEIPLDFYENIQKQVHLIVNTRMPAKILEIQQLIEAFRPRPHSSEISVEVTEEEIVKNKIDSQLVFHLKKEVRELVEMVDIVRTNILLKIPSFDDSHTFETSVQTELVAEFQQAHQSGLIVLNSLNEYFQTRSLLCEKVQKHPRASDYLQAIKQLDETEVNAALRWLTDLQGIYSVLYDVIHKNIDNLGGLKIQTKRRRRTNPLFDRT